MQRIFFPHDRMGAEPRVGKSGGEAVMEVALEPKMARDGLLLLHPSIPVREIATQGIYTSRHTGHHRCKR